MGSDGTGRISRAQAEKDRGLLEMDYASPCLRCGGVVFDWWDSEVCRDCQSEQEESETEQMTLITDGGVEERHLPDPEDDPFACSLCGCAIGEIKRIKGEEYCDTCAREIGAKPPLERCMHCGTRAPAERMNPVDISTDDEYYPEIRYFCRGCSDGGSEA